MIRTYSELIQFNTFDERLNYLMLNGNIGFETFGFDRYLNQKFYRSKEWQHVRDEVIVRDGGCDLGLDKHTIPGKIIIHHMNPITPKDITDISDYLLNPDYLICVSHNTHNAIHYADADQLPKVVLERTKNDTIPWKS